MRSADLLLRLVPPLAVVLAAGCQSDSEPEPGPLRVGVASVRIPAPLGIGTAGYGGFTVAGHPSPFCKLFPATERIHGHPELRAAAISRGPGHEVIFLRADLVGVYQQLRRAIVLELEKRLGRDLDDALIFGGTHTHSGPGRLIGKDGVFDLISDAFFPEFYDRMVQAAADVVERALDDLGPGRIGHALANAPEAQGDRRCEDGKDHVNGALPLLVLERDGEIISVVFSYAIHGTTLDLEDFNLSRDASGAIERAIEDRFDQPVTALFFNSWGADITPRFSPSVPQRAGADQPNNYDKLDAVGLVVADAASSALGGKIHWEERPVISLRARRIVLTREEIGYPDDEFPFQFGATFCGQSLDSDCDPQTKLEKLDQACVPFTKQYHLPLQTLVTTGRVGSLHLVTFPGEATTHLGEAILAGVRERVPSGYHIFVGYAQDYTGYSLEQDDWWQGGYESNGSVWGPRQGEYIQKQLLRVVDEEVKGDPGAAEQDPEPLAPFEAGTFDPYEPATAQELGTILEQVKPSYGPTDTVAFTVAGSDPWLGAPTATLETDDGTPVSRAGGKPIDSDGYAFYVDLEVTPTYKEDRKTKSRRFSWRFNLPVRHKVDAGLPELKGKHRLRVEIPTTNGEPKVIQSAVFEIN